MNDDFVSQQDLDDATIEDTCRCQCCENTFVLGGNDNVIVEVKQANGRVAVLALCIECAAATAQAYRDALREMGLCEHGVEEGKWCPDCNQEYREARARWGD